MSDKVIRSSWFGDKIMLTITAPPMTLSLQLTVEEAQELLADLTHKFEALDVSEPPENLVRMVRMVRKVP